MKLIKEQQLNRRLEDREFNWTFKIEKAALYAIEITASAKSWRQNLVRLRSFFRDDDLTVRINNFSFPKKSGKRGLFDSEVAWSGNNLKGLKKTNLFLIYLHSGQHTLNFLIDQSPKLESIKIHQIEESEVSYLPSNNLPPEDGNRRQWLTITLVNLPLKTISIIAAVKKGKWYDLFRRDDEDLKLIIDGKVQKAEPRTHHKYWYWCGWRDKGKERSFQKELNLRPDLHYIELWTDRSPGVRKIELSGIKKGIFGKVVLHSDIEKTDFVHFRKKPEINPKNIIAKLRDGEVVEILRERVIGDWIEWKSYIWHKVKYQDEEGYILSSFIEVFGQKRERIIEKIREKAKELEVDPNLVLALAGCESKFKPFAVSRPYEEKDEEGDPISAKGIFQLTKDAIKQLRQNRGIYYFIVEDPFEIEQNIEGGIRYLKWLYDIYYKGKRQAIKKVIAAYNAGHDYISADLPLDYSQISSERKRKEAKRTVKCVMENKKRRNWRHIVYPLILIPFLVLTFNFLDENDFFEPVASEKEYLFSQVSHFPSVLWYQQKNQLILFNSQKKIVKRISDKRLNLDEVFQTPKEFRKFNTLIHVYPKVLERPMNVFYFLAANTWSCGQNCRYVLFKYDLKKNEISIVDSDVFGQGIDFYPSPNFKKIAIASYVHGGFCNGGGYIDVVDLADYKREEVSGFKDDIFMADAIESLNWRNDEIFEFEVIYACDGANQTECKGDFRYNLQNKELELIEKNCYFAGGG